MKRLFAALAVLSLLVLAPAVSAYNPLDKACQSGTNTSAACSGKTGGISGATDPISGTSGLLRRVTTLIAIIAGVAAVIVVIIGGLQYITSAGDPQKASSARSTILGALIGLVIIAAAEGILRFILSKVA
jgi:hypothetical protein